ncbi:hypothetical protein B0T14DRAFT_563963 [Immersiella caudata]|uniref:Uncharacterized protein n=1 Tax=Immersiella caudata TaxID=314043 RepID=A0AA39WWF2_9PEZI|nr:hypothetical protein B0T14DRAFT_563963 [Immersiella caudata]
MRLFVLALFSLAALVAGVDFNTNHHITGPELAGRALVKRSCDQGSWKVTREAYTMPANGSQPLIFGISGPSRILLTRTRKASWSNTMGLSFEDARSLNTSFELRETAEDSTERELIAQPGQFGHVAFTAILLCETGTARCNGGEVSGEICTPRVQGTGLDGVINIVTTS